MGVGVLNADFVPGVKRNNTNYSHFGPFRPVEIYNVIRIFSFKSHNRWKKLCCNVFKGGAVRTLGCVAHDVSAAVISQTQFHRTLERLRAARAHREIRHREGLVGKRQFLLVVNRSLPEDKIFSKICIKDIIYLTNLMFMRIFFRFYFYKRICPIC